MKAGNRCESRFALEIDGLLHGSSTELGWGFGDKIWGLQLLDWALPYQPSLVRSTRLTRENPDIVELRENDGVHNLGFGHDPYPIWGEIKNIDDLTQAAGGHL